MESERPGLRGPRLLPVLTMSPWPSHVISPSLWFLSNKMKKTNNPLNNTAKLLGIKDPESTKIYPCHASRGKNSWECAILVYLISSIGRSPPFPLSILTSGTDCFFASPSYSASLAMSPVHLRKVVAECSQLRVYICVYGDFT